MEIKLFGKSLFEFKKEDSSPWTLLASNVEEETKKSKNLFDFYRILYERDWQSRAEVTTQMEYEIISKKKPTLKINKRPEISPKRVYELNLLNDRVFKINFDKKYIDDQLSDFKEKLGFIKRDESDYGNGIKEIASVIMRLENRKKYAQFKKFFDQYPYTTTSKIKEVVTKHGNLDVKIVSEFIADMPREAIRTMKDYDKSVKKLCSKNPVYYIIADKKDFKKTASRRDPILLAQSPFGHFWQILGAWDEEMLFLEEL